MNIYNFAFLKIVYDGELDINEKINLIGECLANGIDINCRDSVALKLAVMLNQYKLVEYLIDNGIDIIADNCNAFKEACIGDNAEIVKLFILSGIDSTKYIYEIIDQWGKKHKLNLDILKILVENNNDCLYLDKTIFVRICSLGDFEIVKYLISFGADCSGSEAISSCIFSGVRANILILLLENGADPNYKITNIPILYYLFIRQRIWICEIILKYGADPNCCKKEMNNYININKDNLSLTQNDIINLFISHGLQIDF